MKENSGNAAAWQQHSCSRQQRRQQAASRFRLEPVDAHFFGNIQREKKTNFEFFKIII